MNEEIIYIGTIYQNNIPQFDMYRQTLQLSYPSNISIEKCCIYARYCDLPGLYTSKGDIIIDDIKNIHKGHSLPPEIINPETLSKLTFDNEIRIDIPLNFTYNDGTLQMIYNNYKEYWIKEIIDKLL